MQNHFRRLTIATFACLGLALGVGCGDKEDEGSGPEPKSFNEIAGSIAEPTGTVDASTVGPVAQEFETLSTTSLGGSREEDAPIAQQGAASQACPAGGRMDAAGSGNDSSGSASVVYHDCCYSAGCCFSGTADTVYSSDGASTFSVCFDYDIDYACEGITMDLAYAACMGAEGLVYSVEVEGMTYAVSGTYSAGSGELTITGANGSWTCSYTNGTGSCTGTGGDFTF